ncbi:MAG: carbohydrate porin [Proteobacteria bacterium]|nr:carbohydrate porin [Pseudomonadota bacterium]
MGKTEAASAGGPVRRWRRVGRLVCAAILVAAAALLSPRESLAQAVAAPKTQWLLGDWNGHRTELFKKGIDLQLAYVHEVAYNLQGGTQQLVDYTDQIEAGFTLDLERLFGLHDAFFQVTYTSRAGRDLVQDVNLGTFQLVQEVYGRGQTVRLTNMFFQQSYFNKLISWKAGRVNPGDDFAAFPCDFQNLTFCGSQPGNVAGNYIFNWPISQWGTRIKVNLEGFGYYQVGFYDQNQQYLGFENKLWPVWYQGSTGFLMPMELGWEPKFMGGKLPGSYKIGAWYSTGQQPSAIYDSFGGLFALSGLPPAMRSGLYGGFVSIQQQVTRQASENPNAGLKVFFNGTVADIHASLTDRQFAAGLWYTGLIDARPYDAIGFAVGTTQQNPEITAAAALQNNLGLGPSPVPVKNSEYVFELDYSIAVRPGFTMRPNLQYIYSPGGSIVTKDIWILGLKTLISL